MRFKIIVTGILKTYFNILLIKTTIIPRSPIHIRTNRQTDEQWEVYISFEINNLRI